MRYLYNPATVVALAAVLFVACTTPPDSGVFPRTTPPVSTEQVIAGGFTEISPGDETIEPARNAVLTDLADSGYDPKEVDFARAATQVVAGLNVRLIGYAGSVPFEALVYQDFGGGADVTELVIGRSGTP